MKSQWFYMRASTQNIMFHSKCVIQETSAFTTGHWAVPLSPRRREELRGGGWRNQNKRQIFSWTLDRNWHDDAEPFHFEVVTSVTSCYPIIDTKLRGVWRMMNVHVSPHIIMAGWCSDRCLLSPQCDHWQWRDHTSGSINYFTALVTSLGVNNKHNHQDNPQSRAPAPPDKVLLS